MSLRNRRARHRVRTNLSTLRRCVGLDEIVSTIPAAAFSARPGQFHALVSDDRPAMPRHQSAALAVAAE